MFLVCDTEALLLIHYEKAEILKRYVSGEEAVRTDDEITFTGGKIFQNAGCFGTGSKPAEDSKIDGKAKKTL